MGDRSRFQASWLPLIVAATIVVTDQLSKWFIQANFQLERDVFEVIPRFFRIVHVQNPGAAWGIMENQRIFLSGISIVMLVLFVVFRRAIFHPTKLHDWAYGLFIGGIIGNLIDRLKTGKVVDFLDFYVGERHWPAFNVADSAICIAVGVYFITTWSHQEPRPHPVDEKA